MCFALFAWFARAVLLAGIAKTATTAMFMKRKKSQSTWTFSPVAEYYHSLAAYTALGFWRDIKPWSFPYQFSFRLGLHLEENLSKACWSSYWEGAGSNKLSAKSK